MKNPSELEALKAQLDNLLDERLAGIAPKQAGEEIQVPVDPPKAETVTAPEIEKSEFPDASELAKPTPPQTDPIVPAVASVVPEVISAPDLSNDKEADSPVSDLDFIKKALKNAAGPFVIYGENYRVIFANDKARELWPETIEGLESGLSIQEATAKQIRIFVPELPEEDVQRHMQNIIASHASREPSELMGAGKRWFRIFHEQVPGEYICIMGVEITELKKREAELEEARKIADDANVAKSVFLAKMSHEIKTPLNAIVGMSDALLEDVDDEDVRETLEHIVTAAEGLTHVLGQTLDHAKLIAEKVHIELQEHKMGETVTKVTGVWKKQCDAKGVKLNVHIHPNTPETIVFDRFRFQQCLNNLLSNAIKFTDEGHITVALKMIEKPGKSPMMALVVQDSGVGMSEDARERIFLPYEQAEKETTRKFGGTGLGLTITKQLVEAMDGSISVQSDLGKGTAFLLTFPADLSANEEPVDAIVGTIAEVPARQSPTPQVVAAAPKAEAVSLDLTQDESPFAGLAVLCVEDNPVNHAVIKKLIGKRVKSIDFANNGEEGLSALSSQHFDVVLMDIHMPVMDGIEATLKIRGSDKPWANVIIIAVTADPDFQYQRVCRNIGMNDAIGKPVKRKDILDSITRSLDVLKETHAQRVELPIAV